ncbi:MAG: T9SS type A sorting domain-containing protein, partial [Bacteroidia bacterium]|nr:T9SS type A sorting domain-containing protein [Bacteroidia bacterium]
SVYPNPAVSILNFDWETTTNQTYTLQVTDVLGKVVNTQHIASDQRTGQVDISTLTKGVYLYQIIGTTGTTNGKFIKE